MAKRKKDLKKLPPKKIKNKVRSWLENKITRIRNLSERRAYRTAKRYGGPAGVALLISLIVYSFFLPKNVFQQAKEQLVRNPNNFEARLILAEEFLKNNQFDQVKKELLAAEQIKAFNQTETQNHQVLGKKSYLNLEKLWQKKYYLDPKDLQKLILAWKKIAAEKPDYRDAFLHLAWLHYQIYEDEKAKDYLQKTIELDPNFEPTLKLQKIIY